MYDMLLEVLEKQKAAFVIPVLRAACGEHAAAVVIVSEVHPDKGREPNGDPVHRHSDWNHEHSDHLVVCV